MAYEREIAEAEDRIRQATSAMAEVRGALIAELGTWVATVSPRLVRDAVQAKPETSVELGVEGLRAIKKALSEFVNNPEAHVEAAVSDPSAWLDLVDSDDERRQLLSTRRGTFAEPHDPPSHWRMLIAACFDPVQTVLAEHGLAVASDRAPLGKKLAYPLVGTELPRAILDLGQRHDQILEEWFAASRDLRDAEQKQVQARAGDLWDEA